MKQLILFLMAIVFVQNSIGQNKHNLDSLQAVLKHFEEENKQQKESLKDSAKVNILYAIGKEYWSSDEAIAMNYAQQVYDLSDSIGFKKGICLAHRSRGYIKSFHSNYSESLDYFFKGLKVADELDDKELICSFFDYIGLVYNNKGDYKLGLEYLEKSLKIAQANDSKLLANIINNMGNSYFGMGDNKNALDCYQRSYEIALKDNQFRQYTVCLMGVGDVYAKEENYEKSLAVHQKTLKLAEEVGDKNTLANGLILLGKDYLKLGKLDGALNYELKALALAKEIIALDHQKNIYELLEEIYFKNKNYKSALKYEMLFDELNDSVYHTNKNEKIAQLQMQYDFDKMKDSLKAEHVKKEALTVEEIKKQKSIRYGIMIGLATVLLFSFVVIKQKKKITKAKHRSDDLLLNILPEEIADELKETGSAKARHYEMVSVMFTDFKDFSSISEGMRPEDLVSEIDYCFTNFDRIISKYNIEKIKTIGDSYMCVGGLPLKNNTNPSDVVKAGIEIRDFMIKHNLEREAKDIIPIEIRIGINTGSVVAGIVGLNKFAYDIWGDTVNIAARLESSCEPMKVNISETTYLMIKDQFTFINRGMISAKNKGEINMYFVEELS